MQEINWPQEITSEQLEKMIGLSGVKNTRAVAADEVENEGLAMRNAAEIIYQTDSHPRWQMADSYARVGQVIRWADDDLGVFLEELESGELTFGDLVHREELCLLLSDRRGFSLLEKVLFEASEEKDLSQEEISGLAAGATRYIKIYEALTAAGVKPRELQEKFYPPIGGGAGPLIHRHKPIPREGTYRVVEEIVPGSVTIDERGFYHVFWFCGKRHDYFQDIQAVLNQHDRVIRELQGQILAIGNGTIFLEIEGEIPRAARFAQRLSFIAGGLRRGSLLQEGERGKLLAELGELDNEIGQVRNEFKKRGRRAVNLARAAGEPEEASGKSQEATQNFLARAQEAADELAATVAREKAILGIRDEWEKIITDSFNILGVYLHGLRTRDKLTSRWLGAMVAQVATSDGNLLQKLRGIAGQPYKNIVAQEKIDKLAKLPEAVLGGDLLRTGRILEDAVFLLQRVVDDRKLREQSRRQA